MLWSGREVRISCVCVCVCVCVCCEGGKKREREV